MSFKIHALPAGPIETNAFLLTDSERQEAILVDAPDGIDALIKPVLASEGCRLTELWLTHAHWDHMQGLDAVVKATGAQVSAHPDDRILLETPGVMEVFLPSHIRLKAVRVDRWVTHGQALQALGRSWEVRHIPGHCPGSVLFWCATEGVAFSGDAILMGGVGRTDFPQCSFAQLARSIREHIYTLPDETVLLTGHGDATRVGVEMRENSHVRLGP